MSVSGCAVAYLVGGSCAGEREDRDVDGERVTVCAAYGPLWKPLAELLQERRTRGRARCRHRHTSAEARAVCERRLARRST